MREIKFRAWSKRKQRWYHKVIEWALNLPKGSYGQLPVLPEGVVLMQYTGLKDKNGKEIYEGDIVKSSAGNPRGSPMSHFVVEYSNEFGYSNFAGFVPFCYDCGRETDGKDCEIIGNIYENPDLLEKP